MSELLKEKKKIVYKKTKNFVRISSRFMSWNRFFVDKVLQTCLSPALDDNYLSKNNASTQVLYLNKRILSDFFQNENCCSRCGQYFTPSDLIEVDHIHPISLGGKDEYKNLQLLHRHCHDDKSASDGSPKSPSLTSSVKQDNTRLTKRSQVVSLTKEQLN